MSAPWIGHRAAQCEGKHPHATYIEALRVAKHLRGKANAYRCPHCHKYHVGHAPKPVRREAWPARTPIHDEPTE